MIVTALAENTSVGGSLGFEHGLSLYIETGNHKILFDTGARALFARNAPLLDTDLSAVDIAFISHGHYDHGGGLKTFLHINGKAKVYLSVRAFDKHFAASQSGEARDIGLDPALIDSGRFVFTGRREVIDGELETFSGVERRRLNPEGNADLLATNGDRLVRDDFAHEQNLVIRSGGKAVLVCGCAHSGIVNILEGFALGNGGAEHPIYPDAVIGGFHLYNPARDRYESPGMIREVAEFLLGTGAKFYTCHCTGADGFSRLKDIMGDAVEYLPGGRTLRL